MKVLFSRTPVVVGESIPEPDQQAIEATFNLRQCSVENAMRYGGPITRAALGAMNIRNDRKYVVVDTKVNFLLPGFIPAIPGWHTDGVPRGDSNDPAGRGEPRITAQVIHEALGITEPRYHLLVTGEHSKTEFLNEPYEIPVRDGHDLYERMSEYVDSLYQAPYSAFFKAPSNTVVEWNWWHIHRAVPADDTGWRYLIRVTETDHIAPRTNLSDFIRTQTQVYVPERFGW